MTQGETAELLEKEVKAHGGLMTPQDLAAYQTKRRTPVRGSYRGYQVLSMPPVSSGGVALIQMLNILEGFDLWGSGSGSAQTIHLVAESMRRAHADRARHLGDPEFNPQMPVDRSFSKEYAATVRSTINHERASKSSPATFSWPTEGNETTHVSVVDEQRNAVSMTLRSKRGMARRLRCSSRTWRCPASGCCRA